MNLFPTKKLLLICFTLLLVFFVGCGTGDVLIKDVFYDLEVLIEGEGTVEISMKTSSLQLSENYKKGTEIILTAVADEGWVFAGWQGDAEGTELSIEVEMTEDKEITAVFERGNYDLIINIVGEGTVDEEVLFTPQSEYPFQTVIKLTAVADAGWIFDRWEGDLESSENPVEIEIDNNLEITVVFIETLIDEDFSGVAVDHIPPGWTRGGSDQAIVKRWAVSDSNLAGGESPEMWFLSPGTGVGSSYLQTPEIDGTQKTNLKLTFNSYLDINFQLELVVRIDLSTDSGATWEKEVWKIVQPGVYDPIIIGPEVISVDLSDYDETEFIIRWVVDGNLGNIDRWCIDNIILTGE